MKYLGIGFWLFIQMFSYCLVQFINLLIHLRPWPITFKEFQKVDWDIEENRAKRAKENK